MKNLFFSLIVFCSLISFCSGVSFLRYDVSNKTAEVLQRDGLYIYIQCTPVKDFTVLGSEKKTITFSGSNNSTIDGVIKKIKKEYPEAQGVIFESIDLTKGDAIKFK
jgi:hypothetical protein